MAKADLVRTLKDGPAPGTANAVTTMFEKMRTTGNYSSSDNDDYKFNAGPETSVAF